MLRRLMDRLMGEDGAPGDDATLEPEEVRLAAAALLVHAAAIDGNVAREERQKFTELVAQRFALDAADTEELLGRAAEAERDAVDLYRFTSVLTRHLDQDGRKEIVGMLWSVVLADGRLDEFEDNLVWRVAELLGVSTHDRIGLKQQVIRKAAGGGAVEGEDGA